MTIKDANEILINGDGLIVTHIDYDIISNAHSALLFEKLIRMAVVIIIKKGFAEIEIDYRWINVDKDENNLIIIGNFNKIGGVKLDNDFEAVCLIVSRKFVSKIIPYSPSDTNKQQSFFPITNIIAMRDRPVLHLEIEEKRLLLDILGTIQINVGRTTAVLRLQILYVSVVAFLMELMNIVIPKYSGEETGFIGKDRKRDIVQEFSSLLFDNFKKEHSVTFYANKLCISPQYLSKATRNKLGVSANKVIADMITTEAVVMLRTPGLSIQQIAHDLGFADQSSFGKFFKKIQGVSPQNYRKRS